MHFLVKRIYFGIVILAIIISYQRCAQVGVLSGGPPDTEPPKVIKTIPENGSVKFNQDFIRIYFNEAVQIKNPNQEIKIFPYTDSLISEINSTSKSLTIKFNPKHIRVNTTYQIHFGKSITDLHEGNVLNNYVFVFSTGEKKDTCRLFGKIFFEDEDKSDVPLYAGLFLITAGSSDSIITSKLPDYLVQVQGNQFRFENLSPGEYFVVVNRFKNNQKTFLNPFVLNYAGKLPNSIHITGEANDTVRIHVMKVYPKKTSIIKKEFSYYGRIRIKFKEPCRVVLKAMDGKILTSGLNPISDSLIYFTNDTISAFKGLMHFPDYLTTDTLIIVRKKSPEKFFLKHSFKKCSGEMVDVKMELPGIANGSAFMNCLHVYLRNRKDSSWMEINLKEIKDSLNALCFQFKTDSIYSNDYRIRLDSLCFSVGGKLNVNSFISDGKIINGDLKEPCGLLNAKFLFRMKGNYILNLLSESGRKIISRKITIPLNVPSEAEFKACLPDNERYFFECIYDDDDNGSRTEGNFWKNILPERKIVLNKKIQVMNNWEINEVFEVP